MLVFSFWCSFVVFGLKAKVKRKVQECLLLPDTQAHKEREREIYTV